MLKYFIKQSKDLYGKHIYIGYYDTEKERTKGGFLGKVINIEQDKDLVKISHYTEIVYPDTVKLQEVSADLYNKAKELLKEFNDKSTSFLNDITI